MCTIRILKFSTGIDMKLKCIYLKRQVILIIQQHDADMEAEYIFIVHQGSEAGWSAKNWWKCIEFYGDLRNLNPLASELLLTEYTNQII